MITIRKTHPHNLVVSNSLRKNGLYSTLEQDIREVTLQPIPHFYSSAFPGLPAVHYGQIASRAFQYTRDSALPCQWPHQQLLLLLSMELDDEEADPVLREALPGTDEVHFGLQQVEILHVSMGLQDLLA